MCMLTCRGQNAGKFIHSVVSLTTGPQTVPKHVLHMVPSSASSLNFKSLLTSSSSSSHDFYPSFYLSFNNMFQKLVLTQDVTN